MRIFVYLLSFTLISCSNKALQLASELGDYTTQQYRDIEDMRKKADSCNYEKECFEQKVNDLIEEVCITNEYSKRGYISENECRRQYPYVFLKFFEAGKHTSIDAINLQKKYETALRQYKNAENDLENARSDYAYTEKECLEYKDDEYYDCLEEAEKDLNDAWDDYNDAWDDYEMVKKEHQNFFG